MAEDVWVPTVCMMCYNECGIKVRRVDGVVAKIEGNPDTPYGRGKLCPKGAAGIMTLYDPYRIKSPLRRTNPDKGIGVDPKWETISWDEALDLIEERLDRIRRDDPRKLVLAGSALLGDGLLIDRAFAAAFGTPNLYMSGAGVHCGQAEHTLCYHLHASWNTFPDYEYCDYLMLFGCNCGFSAYYTTTAMCQKSGDARARGMKVVVVDPVCNTAAEKADEWLPIRPGTDGALALAMLHVLLNELNLYDAEHLKKNTNGPYLVGSNGCYMRDVATGKPLVWDKQSDRPKSFDDPSIGDFALEGHFKLNDRSCTPAFGQLKEHILRYTPEAVEDITTVPAATTRRIASEFGAAARIGSKIVIQGKELPYRPVAAVYFSGGQWHKHAYLSALAISLLNHVLGATDVPGGALGANPVCLGHPGTGRPHTTPEAGPDGLMVARDWRGAPRLPYPPNEVMPPQSLDLIELFPVAVHSSLPTVVTLQDTHKWRIPYQPEAMIIVGSNLLMSMGNPETQMKAFGRIPFVVSFNLSTNETTDALADLVLPDACYLERLDIMHAKILNSRQPPGTEEWAIQIKQPVVPHAPGVRDVNRVFIELAERLGIQSDLNVVLNNYLGLRPPYALSPDKKYDIEQIMDNYYQHLFGPEHNLNWFKQHGILKWPKKIEEAYWRPFVKVRTPIYFEHFIRAGQDVKEMAHELGIVWDTSDYQAMPEWKPCPAHQVKGNGWDFYAIYYKVGPHTFTWTVQNPWLNEVGEGDPRIYQVSLNEDTANRHGIKDGDFIRIESIAGYQITGRAVLSRGIHPEVVAIAGNFGRWSAGIPLARGKGALTCELHPTDLEYMDMPSGNLDLCVKVKVSKA
ncbi:MAG: molybdopterin-dependent oxidoreductase [Chloroflexi bacterium]|nr:molybdopterin-dependent oxidoreductase [Chloroflexota bacterium]